MIKLGVHCYIFTEHWSDERLDLLDAARGLGAEVFEVSVGDDVHLTPRLTRERAEALDIDLTVGPGAEWPMNCDVASDLAEERRLGLAWHEGNIDLTAELGALAYCGALYGHPGAVKRRVPPPDELPRAAEALHHLAEYGRRRGVQIVIEPMSHFRTHLVNTPAQAMHLLALADHDNLWTLLDTYHLVTEVRDFQAAVLTAGPRLWGVHACENDRGAPGGGIVPWDQVFAGLREINFAGVIMLETYNSGIGDFAFRRGMFHNVCPDAAAYVRRGFDFVKEWLK